MLNEANKALAEERFEQAIVLYDKILTKTPQHIEAIAKKAYAQLRLANYPEAIENFSTAISLLLNNASLYSERAVAYHLSGDNISALNDFNKAQELEPKNPYRYSSRAYLKDRMGDTSGAIEDYQKAVELDPEDSIAYNNLGIIQERMGKIEQAKKNFARADELEKRTHPTPTSQETQKSTSSTNEKTNENKAVPNISHQQSPKIGIKEYFRIVKAVFTTKEEFKDFLIHWKNFGKKK